MGDWDTGDAFAAQAGASALGAGINAIAGSISSKKQYKYAKKLMEYQQFWAQHNARNAHQWEVSDLRAAGLNPLLSIDTSGAVAHPAATPSISAPDYGKVDFASSAKWLTGEKKREKELQEQAIKNAEKEGDRIVAQTAKADAESALIMAHIAEGVGTPKQTKNVIYNVIQQSLDNVLDTAKSVYNNGKEWGHLFFNPPHIKAYVMERDHEFRKELERKKHEKSNFKK